MNNIHSFFPEVFFERMGKGHIKQNSIYLFFYIFLSAYYVPVTVLDAVMEQRPKQSPCSHRIDSLVRCQNECGIFCLCPLANITHYTSYCTKSFELKKIMYLNSLSIVVSQLGAIYILLDYFFLARSLTHQ